STTTACSSTRSSSSRPTRTWWRGCETSRSEPVLTAAHVLTHIGLAWIVAGVTPLSVRDRWIVVLAGTLLDLDGAGLVWSEGAYLAAHRAAGHGLLFVVLIVIVALLRADAPWTTAILAAVSFHMHLLLDLVGTG